jgi:hypothetical protein
VRKTTSSLITTSLTIIAAYAKAELPGILYCYEEKPIVALSVDWKLLNDRTTTRTSDLALLIASIGRGESATQIWAVIAQLSVALQPPKAVTLAHRLVKPLADEAVLENLYRHWTASYESPSLDILLSQIRAFEANPGAWQSRYARAIVFV